MHVGLPCTTLDETRDNKTAFHDIGHDEVQFEDYQLIYPFPAEDVMTMSVMLLTQNQFSSASLFISRNGSFNSRRVFEAR